MCQDVKDNHGENLWLWIPVVFSLFIILLIGGFYFYEFRDFVQDNAVWGQFGDYFGGILNPILTFISIILLVFTVISTEKQLSHTEKQLKQTETQLSRTEEINKEQSNSLKLQNFENTFFKLLSLHNDIIENMTDSINESVRKTKRESFISFVGILKKSYSDVLIALSLKFSDGKMTDTLLKNNLNKSIDYEIGMNHIRLTDEEVNSTKKDDIKKAKIFDKRITHLENGKSLVKDNTENMLKAINNSYKDFLTPNKILVNHYFRNLYQILKFVHCQQFDDDQEKNYEIKKRYTNILRAQLSSVEVILLFYNCLSEQGDKLTPLVEKYNLLKYLEKQMLIDENHSSLNDRLTQNSYHYIVNKKRYDLENNKIAVSIEP